MQEIIMQNKKTCIVSPQDFEELSRYKWYETTTGYAIRWIYVNNDDGTKKHRGVRMHREIMKAEDGVDVDHINGNPLDNRRENLRVCTRKQNCANSRARTNTSSRYKGVNFDLQTGKWRARIKVEGEEISLGRHKTELQAAIAYDKAAFEFHGEFAKLNTEMSLQNKTTKEDAEKWGATYGKAFMTPNQSS
jgi:hypothetical protein